MNYKLKTNFNGDLDEGENKMREFIHDHLLTIMVFAPTAGAFLLLLAPRGRSFVVAPDVKTPYARRFEGFDVTFTDLSELHHLIRG